MQKILVIFIGSFFQITLMVAVAVGAARRDLVEAAYTLGATNKSVVRRVIIPGAAPGNCGTAAPGAGLGMDLCHRGGTDWFIQRDRSHDCQ